MADVIVIGGGAIGLSTAYHLATRGAGEVVLLERNTLTSGTSWHAAGIVGPLRATPGATRLAMEALTLFPALEAETGLSTGFRVTGGYWLAREAARMDELWRIAGLGRHLGLTPRIVTGAEVGRALPAIDAQGLAGALHVAEDASVDPVGLCMAYARAAKTKGVTIRKNCRVVAIEGGQGRAEGVRLANGETVAGSRVVLAAGAWSKTLTDPLGVALPLQPVEHMYVVTEPIAGLPAPFPVLRDLDRGVYVKGDAGRLVIGGFEPDAKLWDPEGPEGDRPFLELAEDWDQFAPFMEASLALIPTLAATGIQRFMNGPESFTADTRPLIGETPEIAGLFVAAGLNSTGVMSSAGVGRALADWVIDGRAAFDLWEVDIARADPRASAPDHLAARMREAVADAFALHWPFKQPVAGRGLRRSALHDRWAGAGAVFGVTAGWERALWYAEDAAERALPYSVGAQPWQPIAEREARAMASGVALIDLSPFTKIEVTGPDALALLQRLTTANLEVADGSVVYTPMLNERGGIEADVTVTRLGSRRFRVSSGAATRRKDLAAIARQGEGCDVTIADLTETEAVIGVMGPDARALLASVSEADWGAFPFATARSVTIAGAKVLATRLSFVGELGWELSIPTGSAGTVFDALRAAGAGVLGHYALAGCRIEKGFKHWGHDLGPDVTPLEAGLGFAVDWSKGNFIGREALLRQREDGARRRLTLFDLAGDPLVLHDEPIWSEGRVVGLTTSGAVGPRTGLTLAFGLIEITLGESRADTAARRFEVEIAGRRHRATVLTEPPYDPEGKRMRP